MLTPDPLLQESDLKEAYHTYFAQFGCAQDSEICRLMDALGVDKVEDLSVLDDEVVIGVWIQSEMWMLHVTLWLVF